MVNYIMHFCWVNKTLELELELERGKYSFIDFLQDVYWIPEHDELQHKLVHPPVGRMRISSNNMIAVGKAIRSGWTSMRQSISTYNGRRFRSSKDTDDGYWEVSLKTMQGTTTKATRWL